MSKTPDFSSFINNPHDKFFKELFSHPEAAQDLLQGILPPELLNLLDMSDLKADSTSYVTEDLREFFADLVFTVPYGQNHTLTVSLLIEHKSFVPQQPIYLQLLQYMSGIWNQQWEHHQHLNPILPIVFYHGTQSWKVVSFADYFGKQPTGFPDELRPFLPDFAYLLMNLPEYSEERVRSLFHERKVQMGLLLMKEIFSPTVIDELNTILRDIELFSEQEPGRNFIQTIVVYLYSSKRTMSLDQLVDKMKAVSPKAGEEALTIAERLLQEGMERGREQGREQGIEKSILIVLRTGKHSIKEVAQLFDVEITYVKRLYEQVQREAK